MTGLPAKCVVRRGDRIGVEFATKIACEACEKGRGCGMALTTNQLAGFQVIWLPETSPDVALGQEVQIACSPRSQWKNVCFAYLLPLGAFLLTLLAGVQWLPDWSMREPMAVGMALLALVASVPRNRAFTGIKVTS